MKAIQTYQAPKLSQLGTIRELTKAGGGPASDYPIGDATTPPARS